MTRILVVDNYDSFVYNLVQYVGQLGAEPEVFRHDALTVDAVFGGRRAAGGAPDGVLISPGPGTPDQAGVSLAMIAAAADAGVPVLGVCLGHQCIGQLYGGPVVRHQVMHGKTSNVTHDGQGVFEGLESPLVATRYHSLVVDAGSIPPVLEVTATAEDGTVMGLRHRELPVEGVQFHPESILTGGGHRMVANWLATCGLPAALGRIPASLLPSTS